VEEAVNPSILTLCRANSTEVQSYLAYWQWYTVVCTVLGMWKIDLRGIAFCGVK